MARRMMPFGYGRIINIGSVPSDFGYSGLAPYGASRGGIRQLTMSLADDWGQHGITVNCLAPGWFHTKQNTVLYENETPSEWIPLWELQTKRGFPSGMTSKGSCT
jgi:gluconate 5-dehydrogenase